ncbi:MAG: hypothetical protein J6U14_03800 [Bacteroidaceae bacterium]|nr:hypothetical protein [Bacteroidaceae bacterium]
MKKNFIYSLAAALMMGSAALGISSCSNDELPVGNEAQIAKEVAKTYSFSIPATMDDGAGTRVFTITVGENEGDEDEISSAFEEGVAVWVFIKRSDEFIAYGNSPLTPENVSDDGSSCTLEANGLTFISDVSGFTPAVGDEVYLYYGMTVDTNSNPLEGYFDFSMNDGSKAKAQSMDYNLAKMVITDVDDETGELTFGQIGNETNTTFSFTNINSIFRQRLTFKKGSFIVKPTISSIEINTEHYGVMMRYTPLNESYNSSSITITDPESTDIYFSTLFEDFNKNEAITFTATDTDGNTYTCTKNAPEGGFKNNMYYYGEAILVQEGEVVPTVEGASILNPDAPAVFYTEEAEPFNITISGYSEDYVFYWGVTDEPWGRFGDDYLTEGTITLDNLQATSSFNGEFGYLGDGFIVGRDLSLNLILKGDNVITCKNTNVGILVDYLYLSCDGDSATLTITANGETEGGIYSSNFDLSDLSALAATGYTVDCSAHLTQENTWIYTVTKNNP